MPRAAEAAANATQKTTRGMQPTRSVGTSLIIASFMGNVNSTLSAGNPYDSKDYLKKQNLQASGAMHYYSTLASGVPKIMLNSRAEPGWFFDWILQVGEGDFID